jgi:hypothetical protein
VHTQYRYCIIDRPKGPAFLTLASAKNDQGGFNIGWSITCNGDKPVKNMGRKIADGRLKKFPITITRNPNTEFITDFFASVLSGKTTVPDRYKYPLTEIATDLFNSFTKATA